MPASKQSRRLAVAIIAMVILLPLLGVAGSLLWGRDASERRPDEVPTGGSGGRLAP